MVLGQEGQEHVWLNWPVVEIWVFQDWILFVLLSCVAFIVIIINGNIYRYTHENVFTVLMATAIFVVMFVWRRGTAVEELGKA